MLRLLCVIVCSLACVMATQATLLALFPLPDGLSAVDGRWGIEASLVALYIGGLIGTLIPLERRGRPARRKRPDDDSH